MALQPATLAFVVVLGTALVVCAAWWSWRSDPAAPHKEEAVRAAFAERFPDERISEMLVGEDGASALLRLGSGRLGLVWQLGDNTVLRCLRAERIRLIERPDGLLLGLGEVGAPRLRLRLSEEGRRRCRAWLGR